MCSAGLGAKKRAKPPKQTRDVRPPAKLLKLAPSPVSSMRGSKTMIATPSVILIASLLHRCEQEC